MDRWYREDRSAFSDIIHSLKEYLCYLRDSRVREVCLPEGEDPASDMSPDQEQAASNGKKIPPPLSLERVREELGDCRRCGLASSRTRIVFGEGNAHARILFIGEGPGYEEDMTGIPFVGKAGKLLTQILERGMGIARTEVYICNVVKCRPPQNRDPHEDEIAACFPFLEKQIDSIRPQVIITLGLHAARSLLGIQPSMTLVRGRWHSYKGIPVMPTYHPAYVLRNYTSEIRRQVWDDVREALKALE